MSTESSLIKTRNTLVESTILTGGVGFATFVATQLIQHFDLPIQFGNANADEIGQEIRNNPLRSYFNMCVVAPINEELIFRGIPLALLMGQRKYGVVTLGAISTLGFGFAHNLHIVDGEFVFSTNTLPLPQLILGAYQYRTAVKRGLEYSVLSHATVNSIATTGVLLGY